jgi:uncharacterized protein involved in exopolysaccharide biosynthesis
VSAEFHRDEDPAESGGPGSFSDEFSVAGEPNTPPRGLMRKRPPTIVWIALALLLGGFIALILTALVTD